MKSIRSFLIAGVLATLTLFNFVASLRGFQSSMQEVESLFDNQLLDIARLVANLDESVVHEALRLDNNLAFQVWDSGHLRNSSTGAPPTPIAAFVPGFDYANFSGYRWRTFSRHESPADSWVMVAERTDLRFTLAESVVLESVTPVIVSIPLVGLLIWVVISQGLYPLRELSAQLRSKPVTDLSPVQIDSSRQELDQVIDSVNGLMRRLRHALEREQRFSADAAHELRTPISALKVQLYNLRQEMDPDSDSFKQLQQGVERMQHLVEQLLLLYRITPEEFARNLQSVNLLEISQTVIARHFDTIERKRHHLELLGACSVIRGDSFALETMLSNLLLNAAKYTPEGGNIVVALQTLEDGTTLLTVEDNGPGIAAPERERVFERFYRSSCDADASQTPGCGLGLTIVAHVAELHDARLALEPSSLGSGCRFTIHFPR